MHIDLDFWSFKTRGTSTRAAHTCLSGELVLLVIRFGKDSKLCEYNPLKSHANFCLHGSFDFAGMAVFAVKDKEAIKDIDAKEG